MLLDAFKNPPQTREEGIYFDDRQYKCVRADKNSIYGKCVSSKCKNYMSEILWHRYSLVNLFIN